MLLTQAHLEQLFAANVLPAYNAPAPKDGQYGWLRAGELALERSVTLEHNVGLYGGPYYPLIGGRLYCGLCAMGAFSYSYSALPEPLVVGRYCSISSGLRFLDSAHPHHTFSTSAALFRPHNKLFAACQTEQLRGFADRFNLQGSKPFPRIGHDVWIGANVTLGMGITIGTGAVIATHSVVTKDVPPYAIMAGNPAELKGYRFDSDLIARLQASRWWEKDPQQLFALNVEAPNDLCAAIEAGKVVDGHFPALTLTPEL